MPTPSPNDHEFDTRAPRRAWRHEAPAYPAVSGPAWGYRGGAVMAPVRSVAMAVMAAMAIMAAIAALSCGCGRSSLEPGPAPVDAAAPADRAQDLLHDRAGSDALDGAAGADAPMFAPLCPSVAGPDPTQAVLAELSAGELLLFRADGSRIDVGPAPGTIWRQGEFLVAVSHVADAAPYRARRSRGNGALALRHLPGRPDIPRRGVARRSGRGSHPPGGRALAARGRRHRAGRHRYRPRDGADGASRQRRMDPRRDGAGNKSVRVRKAGDRRAPAGQPPPGEPRPPCVGRPGPRLLPRRRRRRSRRW